MSEFSRDQIQQVISDIESLSVVYCVEPKPPKVEQALIPYPQPLHNEICLTVNTKRQNLLRKRCFPTVNLSRKVLPSGTYAKPIAEGARLSLEAMLSDTAQISVRHWTRSGIFTSEDCIEEINPPAGRRIAAPWD